MDSYIQVKGTTRLRRDGQSVLFTVDTPHLQDWAESRLPVLLAVCDTAADEGFWLLVGAPGVIAFMERPRPPDDPSWGPHFWVTADNPYRQPLPPPDESLHDLALARCILCENYFWIDERLTDGHDRIEPGEAAMPANLDFTQIYGPRAHEPAVYSCDSPEEFCVFCTTGNGALLKCKRCGKHNVTHLPDLADWDDPAVTRQEAEEHCAECLDCLRAQRSGSQDRGA